MKPIILMIFDGFGVGQEKENNAILKAKTPTLHEIHKLFPSTTLQASSAAVGLIWGEAGNSEVGHLTIGAGRVIYQHLPRIIFAIRDGSFFKNPEFLGAINHVKRNRSRLHMVGMIGSGSVHSYIDHLYALLDLAKQEGVSDAARLHLFTDGLDSPPREAGAFLKNLSERINALKLGNIATIIGRHYAMDRNNNWDRTETAYRLLTEGVGEIWQNPVQALERAYEREINDEAIPPIIIQQPDQPAPALIADNDAVIFFNFREDRERQLARAFTQPDFDKFIRRQLNNLYFVAMTEYEKNLPARIAFPPIDVKNSLGEVLSKARKRQLRVAETEKYAHVTYFFNGGKEIAFPGEERVLVSSRHGIRPNEQPEMAAYEITDRLIGALEKRAYDLIVVNYANADMVGHTGDFEATVKAVEVLDRCLALVYQWAMKNEALLIITADHGNAEEKFDLMTGEPRTEHSLNPVPFYLISQTHKRQKSEQEMVRARREIGGLLSDVAPTVLELADIPKPSEMTGKSLLKILI